MIAARAEDVLALCREAGALELAEPLIQRHVTETEASEVLQRFAAARDSLADLRFDDVDADEMAGTLALHMDDEQISAHVAAIAVYLGRANFEATLPQPDSCDLYQRPAGRANGNGDAHHAEE